MTVTKFLDPLLRLPAFASTLFLAVTCQFILVAYTFPLSELFTETPLFHIDNAMHWYRLKMAVANASIGNLTGYDPFFAAGTDYGITGNPGAKLGAVLAVVLHPIGSEIVAWKLFTFMAALLAAGCLPVAARLLGLSPRAVVVAAILGLLMWWVSMFRWYHTAGMVSFVLVAYVGVAYLAYLIKYIEADRGVIPVLILGGVGAVATFCHPLFPLPIVFATPLLLLFYRQQLTASKLLAVVLVIPFLALLPNLLWLVPITTGMSFFTPAAVVHQSIVDPSLLWKELFGIWSGDSHGSKLNPIIMFLSITALIHLKKAHPNKAQPDKVKYRRLILLFFVLGIVLLLYSSLGSAFALAAKHTQPNRFSPLGYLILIIPAAIGAHSLFSGLTQWRQSWLAKAKLTATGLIGMALLLPIYELHNELSYQNVGHYGALPPEAETLGSYTTFILDFLRLHTTTEGRILFETANHRVHDESHIAGYYANASNREFIGGPYPFSHFAGYWDGILFNRPIETWPKDEFNQYLELYNIGWIIAYSSQSKNYYSSMENVHMLAQHQEVTIYAVDRALSYFQVGSGKLSKREHNKLEFTDIRGDSIVLRYHFSNRLQSEPPLPLLPVKLLGDPIPFIEIRQPPSTLKLFVP